MQANTDGGLPTALFAFDREREHEIARRYTSKNNPELLAVRLGLADAVLIYRQTREGVAELVDLCVREAGLSGHWKSVGYKRLGELAADGHEIALATLRGLLSGSNALIRRTSFVLAATKAFSRLELIQQAELMLTDRSTAVREAVANEAVLRDWFELANPIRSSIGTTRTMKGREGLLFCLVHLLDNERTGNRAGYRYVGDERWAAEKAELLPQI